MAADELVFRPMPDVSLVCSECGCGVADLVRHAAWHDTFDELRDEVLR